MTGDDAPAEDLSPLDVEQAAADVAPHLTPTPLQASPAFSEEARSRVFLKLESVHPIRTFKLRGAFNRILHIPFPERDAGVVTASAGNHGLGVAFAALTFAVPATVFVPETANPFKVAAIGRLGAKAVPAGGDYSSAYAAAVAFRDETGGTFVHAYDDRHVIAGQGTIGLEILRDLPDVDTVLVPVGGGGLIGGIALYIKERRPDVRVIGVEPTGADAMRRSLEAGHAVVLESVRTIADGLAASAPGRLTLELARRYVDEMILVDDEEMVHTIRLLFEWEHLLAEPAGAAALAALLYHHAPRADERVAVVLSGANVTDEVMRRALSPR